jgi:hypothetical protein
VGQFVYNEQSLSTSSLVLASIFLLCGASLRRILPLSWDDIYSSLDAYLDGSKASTRITFHFEKAGMPAGKIYAACLDKDAELKFEQALESAVGPGAISEAHANAEVRLSYSTLLKIPKGSVDFGALNGAICAEDSGAEEKFSLALSSRAPKMVLLAAHAVALSEACAEAIRARAYLVNLMRAMPECFKWDVIEGDGGGHLMVRVNKGAGNLLREEYLSRL